VKAREEILNSVAVCFGEERQGLILFKGGVLTKKERKIPYSEVVKAKGLPIVVQGHYKNEEIGPQASICAQMAEVEVDPETGQIYLNKFLSAHSTGKVLNPLMHDGQIDGGIVMGLGYALMEEVFFADGRVASANFGDYKIPTIRDIPKLRKIVSETPVGRGPYSSMSIGETPIITVAPAIANAIHDAVGVRIKSLPLTAEKVLRGLSEREGH
jgi:CO/xanthine dehydrogenase Mo-binding subunit